MKLVGRLALICGAGILLVLAVPFALVQLDLISAGWLRLVPVGIALVIASTILAAIFVRKKV